MGGPLKVRGAPSILSAMQWLRRFEDWVAGWLEGRLGAALGGRLEPADITRRLDAHLEDHLIVGAGTRYAPNRYRVYLALPTAEHMSAYRDELERELAATLRQHADALGAGFLGKVVVSVLPDPRLGRTHMRIESDLVGGGAGLSEPGGATMAIAVQPEHAGTPPPLILVGDGARLVLQAESGGVRIGRALDNDLILEEPSVSRHHALLMPHGVHWLVEDQGSRHGVFVNDRRVVSGLLRPKDDLRLGRAALRVVEAGDPGRDEPSEEDAGPDADRQATSPFDARAPR